MTHRECVRVDILGEVQVHDPEYIEGICHHIQMKEKEHNLIQVEGEAKEKTLDYEAHEAGVVGGFLIKH